MRSMENIYIPQAVDDEHSKDGRRKIFSNILYKFRCLSIFTENDKRKETGRHCSEDTESDGNDLLGKCHGLSASFFLSFFLNIARKIRIRSMVGIIKASAPKRIRHRAATASPRTEAV